MTETTIDQYSGLLNHAGWEPTQHADGLFARPRLRPTSSLRRLGAYTVLKSYLYNSSRYVRRGVTIAKQNKIKELGDPQVIVNRVVSAIIGGGAVFTVEGSQRPTDTPAIPALPDIDPTGDDDIDAQLEELVSTQWRATADEIVAEWQQAWEVWQARRAAQQWWDSWSDTERVASKLWEMERDGAVGLGDGVLVLGWDDTKQRVSLSVYEPDFYEPVIEDDGEEFPNKVHLLWEWEDDGKPGEPKAKFLRRVTYELVDRDTITEHGYPGAWPWETRDRRSDVECVVTDLTWRLSGDGANPPGGIDDTNGTAEKTLRDGELVEVRRLPIGVPFIPVIHVPNTPASKTHFGQALLTPVVHILDQLQARDTDLEAASALAGAPAVWASGVTATDKTLRPGTIYGLGENGRMATLDMSQAVTSLLAVIDATLKRLAVNVQVPEAALGRIDASDVPSGVALLLSFAPIDALAAVLRLVRFAKYRLLFKFAYRMHQVHATDGVLADGETPSVNIEFASTTPTDLAATVRHVRDLLQVNGLPRRVGLQLLKDAGLHDDDIDKMLAEIEAEDTEGAKNAADATGSEAVAASKLGVKIDDDVSPVEEPEAAVIEDEDDGGDPDTA